MTLFVIPERWQPPDTGWHPLALGDPPGWAEGWGQTDGYVYIEVVDHRFVWCPCTEELGYGIWFCETQLEQIPDSLLRIGIRSATDVETVVVEASGSFAFRMAEVRRDEDYRRRCDEAERALLEDMCNNPEKYKKAHEEAKEFSRKINEDGSA